MFRVWYKEAGDLVWWKHSKWIVDYDAYLKTIKPVDFFVENEHRMIVYSM